MGMRSFLVIVFTCFLGFYAIRPSSIFPLPSPPSFNLSYGNMESAAKMVVEGGLGAFFEHLFEKLPRVPFLKNLVYLFGVKNDADKLSKTLLRIESLLIDAEKRQINEESVRLWLSELKDVAYDAEDILDELAYIDLGSRLEAPIQTRKRKLTQVIDFFSRASSNIDLGSRIKKIREGLDDMVSENKQLDLKEKVISGSERLQPVRDRPPTGSMAGESPVIGRDADKKKVVGLILTQDDNDASSSSAGGRRNGVRVIPICGMGGLGKTTLARLVYNDERVTKHFVVRAWVHVSQDFDLIRLSKAILESVTGSSSVFTNFDTIQVSIKDALKGKMFLLVLDDVWNENCDDCCALLAPLMDGARGSRVLVTTRSQSVSEKMGTVSPLFLQGLSDRDCLSLLQPRAAFVEGSSDGREKLVKMKICNDIVEKCKGLPLAVKTLGPLLCPEAELDEWEAILNSEIWDLREESNSILPALRLSYNHLPAHLKPGFAYLCLFRKGDYLTGCRLVHMWMAHGFIQSKGSMPMEYIGRDYLADLVSRSFLDFGLSGGNDRMYKLHNVTHDFARSVSGAEILVKEHRHGQSHENVENARHMSYLVSTTSYNFEDLCCLKRMRTLVLKALEPTFITNIPADLFINLRHIRVLECRKIWITELPESIGKLIHLRYLDLSETRIKRLPKSTTRLYYLQTLLLDSCNHLAELPSDLTKLVNLKLLSLHGCSVSIPPGIGRLTSLKIVGGC